MYDGCIAAMDQKNMEDGKVIESVKCHEKIIAELERNIEVLKAKIHQERLVIQKLQDQCLLHNFQDSPLAGEFQKACICCGMTI